MPKIHFEKIVRAKRDRVFSVAANYEEFERMLPRHFPSVRIRSRRDNVAVVEEHLRVAGRELVMTTKHVTAYPELHEVFVIGGDAKGSHIIERYEQVPEGTRITVDADIRLKGAMKLAGLFGKKKILNGLSNIMDEFAKIAEG